MPNKQKQQLLATNKPILNQFGDEIIEPPYTLEPNFNLTKLHQIGNTIYYAGISLTLKSHKKLKLKKGDQLLEIIAMRATIPLFGTIHKIENNKPLPKPLETCLIFPIDEEDEETILDEIERTVLPKLDITKIIAIK